MAVVGHDAGVAFGCISSLEDRGHR